MVGAQVVVVVLTRGIQGTCPCQRKTFLPLAPSLSMIPLAQSTVRRKESYHRLAGPSGLKVTYVFLKDVCVDKLVLLPILKMVVMLLHELPLQLCESILCRAERCVELLPVFMDFFHGRVKSKCKYMGKCMFLVFSCNYVQRTCMFPSI